VRLKRFLYILYEEIKSYRPMAGKYGAQNCKPTDRGELVRRRRAWEGNLEVGRGVKLRCELRILHWREGGGGGGG
jgi:hypothetical protein